MPTTSINQTLKCELVEKELIEVQLYQVDLINRTLAGLTDVNIDNVQNNEVLTYDSTTQKWVNKDITIISTDHVFNENPTEITTTRFQVVNNYQSGTLRVYLNGIKFHNSDITEINSNTFDIALAKEATDTIEVDYLKN